MGARSYWAAPLPQLNYADGTSVTGTTLADISPSPQKAIPARLLELGTIIRLRARGECTNGATATTATIGFYYGGAAANLPLASLTGQTIPASTTAAPWWMEYEGDVRALAASGTIKGMGWLDLPTSLTAWTHVPMPATAAARIATVDTTADKIITVAASVSQTVGAPSITCYSLTAEILG